MTDSDDFDSDFDDELMNEVLDNAINKQVTETVIRHPIAPQRTLTGEIMDKNQPVQYEEIRRSVSFGPTHHELNSENLRNFVYPSNLEMRDYQYDIICKTFYKNLLCAIPTGMGKTFIASTVMLNYYRWFPKSKIIFMAPTRPLVAQQIQACLGVTNIDSNDTAILLDKTRRNRPEIWNNKRVFFTTPQVVENDLKSGILNPKEIVCLVIDEAHRARGSYAYTNVVQFILRFNTSFRVLALTATPAADIEGVQEVVTNLNISRIEIRTEESMDIVKYMKRKDTVRIHVGYTIDIENIIEWLGSAIDGALKKANEANIYDVTDPSRINAFNVMQKSQAIIKNPSLPEGLKWNYYFILQVIGFVGQMLKRLKIYGVRTFYSYFKDKCSQFRTKFNLKKSNNKIAKEFFFHPSLAHIERTCDALLEDPGYISHPKLERVLDELLTFFESHPDSRVIIFTELRESALEIVKCVDHIANGIVKPHIFIGQSRAKEPFDEDDYTKKNAPKGRTKKQRQERLSKEQQDREEKERQKQEAAEKRKASRTYTSEQAQLQGMNQKTQKEIIKGFKKGQYNVLVATSIGEEGLDIGEVDLIICYDSTSSPIKNIQRMGRTGRKHDGKVILLLSSNEESKFNQSMEDYAGVQKQIAGNALDMPKTDRIIPANIEPVCLKQLIDIPEDNLKIAEGEDEDEIIKYATQAMLGQNVRGKKKSKVTKPKKKSTLDSMIKEKSKSAKPAKRFFMPDNVNTGFVTSSKLVKKVGQDSSPDTSRASVSITLDSDGEIEEEKELNQKSTTVNNNSSNNDNSKDKSLLKDDDHDFSDLKDDEIMAIGALKRKETYEDIFNSSMSDYDDDFEPNKKPKVSGGPLSSETTSVSPNTSNSITPKKDGTQEAISKNGTSKEVSAPSTFMKPLGSEDTDRKNELEYLDNDQELADASEEEKSIQKPIRDSNSNVTGFVRPTEVKPIVKTASLLEDIFTDEEEEEEEVFPPNVSLSQEVHDRYKAALDELDMLSQEPLDRNSSPVKSNNDSYINKLFTFEAFEDPAPIGEDTMDEVDKVMDKQDEQDPDFSNNQLSSLPTPTEYKAPLKRKPVRVLKKVVEETKKSKSFDITNLLKETSVRKKTLGARRRLKADLSKVKKENIVNLDEEIEADSGAMGTQRKAAQQHQHVLSQPDNLKLNVSNINKDDVFDINQFPSHAGFLSGVEEERFLQLFNAAGNNIPLIEPDPTKSCKLKFKSNGVLVQHGKATNRFSNYIEQLRSADELQNNYEYLLVKKENSDQHNESIDSLLNRNNCIVFTKEDVHTRTNVKSSVQRGLKQKFVSQFSDLESSIDDIIPKKSQVELLKCEDKIQLYVCDNEVVFYQQFDELIPSLRLVHKYPSAFPRVKVDRGAIKFVLSGANIMCPGLTSAGAELPEAPGLEADTIVAIYAEGKEHALAIGKLLMSTEDIKSVNKGIGIELIHYLGDGLWNFQLD